MMKFIRGQRNNNNARNFILGISKQPCYLCHRYFEWINAHSNQKFILSESHNKIYGLWDFPNGNEKDIKIGNDLHEKIETLIKIELTSILKKEIEKREERMKSDSTTNDFSLEETNIVLCLRDEGYLNGKTNEFYVDKTQFFKKWYDQVILKGELITHYDVPGCYILRPWAIRTWDQVN
ncbi:unnamed protein product [Didymodactylos carnosus]|uniref:Uncharacterized protein n=1 Tax=Didymodactylos carnosus TaxID=1234261 RepID=A0A8S2F5G0_9BILA|nr:unnamed protein product [Didymodactylos carnosus]CAF4142902.1 unnamed protein product [Didymodactylos carnosus]